MNIAIIYLLVGIACVLCFILCFVYLAYVKKRVQIQIAVDKEQQLIKNNSKTQDINTKPNL